MRKVWGIITALSMASCVSPGSECAGWEPITVADATVDYLAQHDREALAAMVTHHEFGQRQGCWK